MANPEKVELIVDNLQSFNSSGDFIGNNGTRIEQCVLLYPSEDAIPVDCIPSTITTLVVIDGTWSQAKTMCRILSTKTKCITLNSYSTKFWRFQNLSDEYLSTIEAIYYFFKEYHEKFVANEYANEYDDLLYYFQVKYGIIQEHYRKNASISFTKRHRLGNDYIQRH